MKQESVLSQQSARDTELLRRLGYVEVINRTLRKSNRWLRARLMALALLTSFGMGVEDGGVVAVWH